MTPYIIVEQVAGSRLYGTFRPDSDTDIRGVALMPVGGLIGLDKPFEQLEQKVPDRTIWELRKFVKLALACNPNILDQLFAPRHMWISHTPEWQLIYDLRHEVLSQQVRIKYAGYASSQLHRIKNHRFWTENTPTQPDITQYGRYNSRNQWVFDSEALKLDYANMKKHWEDYSTWLAKRNPARRELEEQFGYDVKHACHLVRLLLQAEEILTFKTFSPVLSGYRLDTVLAVLQGKWSYDELIVWADERFERIKTLPSSLPDEGKSDWLHDAVMTIYAQHIKRTSAGRLL